MDDYAGVEWFMDQLHDTATQQIVLVVGGNNVFHAPNIIFAEPTGDLRKALSEEFFGRLRLATHTL